MGLGRSETPLCHWVPELDVADLSEEILVEPGEQHDQLLREPPVYMLQIIPDLVGDEDPRRAVELCPEAFLEHPSRFRTERKR